MNNNTYLILGFVGIAVTFLLQMLIVFVIDEQFENWWVFYLAWFTFLIIGIGKQINRKKNNE